MQDVYVDEDASEWASWRRKWLKARMARISACQSCKTVPLVRRAVWFAGRHFIPVLDVLLEALCQR